VTSSLDDQEKAMIFQRPSSEPCIDAELIGATHGLQRVIAQLAEAGACARRMGCDPWEFAIELEVLIAEGVMANDLRWLVKKGYIEHAQEVTRARDTIRRFRSCCNLGFSKRTCFVLTAAGALMATGHDSAPISNSSEPSVIRIQQNAQKLDRSVPSWDCDRRVLCAVGCIVKQYKVPSPSQEAILAAFEEEGWPSAIDDPLPPHAEQDSKRRLRNTIQSLNANQKNSLLRFRGDGSGQRIIWDLVDDRAVHSTAKKRRFVHAA
jgi:hypothetical protein